MPTATAREYPILFRPELVRKILDGKKTQTRRPLKPQPYEGAELECGWYEPMVVGRDGYERPGKTIFGADDLDGEYGIKFPFGGPGSVLWVRETWAPRLNMDGSPDDNPRYVKYRADSMAPTPYDEMDWHYWDCWRPSIQMPRWACRMRLEITDVRVERIQSVSEADAIAEGMEPWVECYAAHPLRPQSKPRFFGAKREATCREAFEQAWNAAYPGSWERNDFVWAISFKVL